MCIRDSTLTLYLEHMNRYSSLGAKMAVEKGHRSFSVLDIVVRPLATFVYNYFIRLGFLDGDVYKRQPFACCRARSRCSGR